MMHLVAYYQSVIINGALTKLNAVADQAIRTDGQDVVVPSDLANLVMEAALSASTTPEYGQVQSPSLRQLANQDVQPIIGSLVFGSDPPVQAHFGAPRLLKGNESLNFANYATDATAAGNYGLVILSNGAITPVTGNMFSVRATSAVAQAAGSWENGALTFDETLPAGTYNVVGFRAVSTDGVAARLVFVGSGYRPGVPMVNTTADRDFYYGRHGRMGSFGVFDVNQPPTVDVLGGAAAVQEYVFDLVKVS